MPKPKIGKDVLGKKSGAIIRTKREAEEYEEYKRKKAQEEEEQKQKKKLKPILKSRMPDEPEGRIEGLTPEEFAEMKALARLKKSKRKVEIE